MILHLLSRSPFTSSCLQDCLRLAAEGDRLLLLGDGVYATLDAGAPLHGHTFAAIYALTEDLESRGLPRALPMGIKKVDYQHFVSLCCEADRILSWY